jgi:two-component system, chemotaxis family, response regulator Rcp1
MAAMTPAARRFEILHVEDNPGDVRLTREALADQQLPLTLHVVENGEDAMAFLRRATPYQHASTPDLILLDLNLPRRGGREVLADIKSDPALRHIPIIVLTSSAAEADVLKAYALGANCYITKPAGFDEFGDVVRAIDAFWLTVARLPSVR